MNELWSEEEKRRKGKGERKGEENYYTDVVCFLRFPARQHSCTGLLLPVGVSVGVAGRERDAGAGLAQRGKDARLRGKCVPGATDN